MKVEEEKKHPDSNIQNKKTDPPMKNSAKAVSQLGITIVLYGSQVFLAIDAVPNKRQRAHP